MRGRVLTCELHSLLYEIECDRMAEKANDVIDSNMGKGHSNLFALPRIFLCGKLSLLGGMVAPFF